VYSGRHTQCKRRKTYRVETVSKAGDGDGETRGASRTVPCSRGVTLNKETRITSEALHQAVVTPGLTKKVDDILPCDTTFKGMEVVRGTQGSDLSFYTCTSSEEQSEVASTKSERISNLEGARDNVTGGGTDVICLSENNRVISPPEHSKSDLPFLSADEKTRELHGKYTEKNSRTSRTTQHLIHSPLPSDNHDLSQMGPQKHDVEIQCELLCDRGLSGFYHSHVCCVPIEIRVINDSANITPENPIGITNLSREVEVFATESGAMNSSRHSDESAKKKQTSPELLSGLYKPPNDPNVESPKSSTFTMQDTHIDKPYGLGKNESDSNNSAPKNNTIIQDNIYCGTDTAVQGMDQSAANVTAHKSCKNDSRNNQDVRKTLHNVRDSNRTVTTDDEVSRYSESLKRKPSTSGVDRNYWTNGNKTPFAMAEVFLAAKQISNQRDKTHKIGPLRHFNISESSRNMNDEDGNQQQIHKAISVFNLECSTQKEKQSMALTEHHLRAEQRKVNCFNDTEEVHTITGKARPVNISCVTEGLSGRLSTQDMFSNSSRGNNPQLHLYRAGEPLIVLSPCSSVSNSSTTCEETVSDYENVLKTEGTTDVLSENGEKVVALETPEGTTDMLSENGEKVVALAQSTNIRSFTNTAPVFDKVCSTSRSDIRKNPDGVPFCFNKNDLNSSPSCNISGKLQIVFFEDSFSINNASRGNETKQQLLSIPSEMSSDDLFPSNQMPVTKTYGRANHSQDAFRSMNQKSEHFYTSQKYKPTAFSFIHTLRLLKRNHEQ
jgi:hypothetical protein